MNISKETMKTATLFGLILGAIGLIAPLIFYVLIVLFFLSAPLIMIYLNKISTFDFKEYKNTALFGGALGFVAFLGFMAVFAPCVLVISAFFKSYYNYGLPYLLNFQAIWLFLLIVITTAFICACTNAVGAMAVHFINSLKKGN